jgi:hypothetical protein
MLRLPGLVAILATTLLVVSEARAQTSRSDRDAIEAFETGTRAADEERWSDALPAFRRAYALSRSEIALFNVGYVLRSLGRFVEARAAFDEVIDVLHAEGELLAQANAYRDEVLARIAHLRLEGLDADAEHTILVDGVARQDDGARPLDVSIDAGAHGLGVRREGRLPFDWSGTIAEGQTLAIDVTLSAVPSGGTVADDPWLWIVIGAVVVGAAIGIGFVVDDAVQLDPAPGRTVIRL